MSEHIALEFEAPTGERLSFEWDAERISELAAEPPAEPLWQLGGELDWDEIERVRVLSARLGDGRLLAIAALLPNGAEGHGDEFVAGAIGDQSSFEQLDEALLSAEYGQGEELRRIGLELYASDVPLTIRASGTVSSQSRSEHGGVARLTALIGLSDGGRGVLDLVTRA